MCLVDLENAFDCVPWGVLQEGMGYLGCCYNPFNQIIQLLQELDLHSQQKVGHVPPEGGLRADTGKAGEIISLSWPGKASVPPGKLEEVFILLLCLGLSLAAIWISTTIWLYYCKKYDCATTIKN